MNEPLQTQRDIDDLRYLAALRVRFREVLAEHGHVSIDDLDQVCDDLINTLEETS